MKAVDPLFVASVCRWSLCWPLCLVMSWSSWEKSWSRSKRLSPLWSLMMRRWTIQKVKAERGIVSTRDHSEFLLLVCKWFSDLTSTAGFTGLHFSLLIFILELREKALKYIVSFRGWWWNLWKGADRSSTEASHTVNLWETLQGTGLTPLLLLMND